MIREACQTNGSVLRFKGMYDCVLFGFLQMIVSNYLNDFHKPKILVGGPSTKHNRYLLWKVFLVPCLISRLLSYPVHIWNGWYLVWSFHCTFEQSSALNLCLLFLTVCTVKWITIELKLKDDFSCLILCLSEIIHGESLHYLSFSHN